MISYDVINEIKFRNNIEDTISSYVTLKRAGSNYQGLCPFHSEKSPSFTVFPSTQSFYCFGCGVGGDVIHFVMKAENLDYVSAVRLLASRSGITIPEDEQNKSKGASRQRVLDMNREAAKFFHQCLSDEKLGKAGRDYLMGERKLSISAISHFGLGYAPNQSELLSDYLTKLGYTKEEMIEGFLCGKNQNNGKLYDYYRNRVIFPIIDVSGNVVAFGGRVLDNSKPKYLNTSDTPAFKKSKNLFALNFAKNNCKDMMILCEGYMDVIALHNAGFEFAVATLGTAITPEQARIFKNYTNRVIISYDSDEAGQKAANKAFNLLQEVGVDVRILQMSGAKDPDEFIKKFGADEFRKILNASVSRFDYEYDKIIAKYNVKQTDEKIRAIKEICQLIGTFYSKTERDIYASKIAKELDIPKETILKDVDSLLRKKIKEEKIKDENRIYMELSGISDRVNRETASNLKEVKTEEAILGMMQLHEDCLKYGCEHLVPEDFITSFSKRVFESVKSVYEQTGKFSVSFIGENFSDEEISRITKMMIQRQELTDNSIEILTELIDVLKKFSQKEQTVDISNLFKNKR